MEPEIIFAPSAFKHCISEEDIRHDYKTRVFARRLEGYDNKYGFIGFNRAGNPVEVFYNPIGEDTIKVFHAMGMRAGVLEQLRNQEKTMTYTDLTDEEYDALDEELSRTIPKFGPHGSDWLIRRELRQLGLGKLSLDYLLTKSAAVNKSPAQIIDEMVLEKVTAAAECQSPW